MLVTPPPVDRPTARVPKGRYEDAATGILERTNENAGRYAAECKRVADQIGVPCCNLWESMQRVSGWSKFLSDGLHFTPQGNRFVGAKLLETIEASYPEITVRPCAFTGSFANSGSSCEALEEFLPWHDKIDHTSFQPYAV